MINPVRANLGWFTLATAFAVSMPVAAVSQEMSSFPSPPTIRAQDKYGVNMLSATWKYVVPLQLHSDIDGDLDYFIFTGDGNTGWGSSLQAYLYSPNSVNPNDSYNFNVVIGRASYEMVATTQGGTSTWTDRYGMGNILTYNSSTSKYTFTTRTGVQYLFDLAPFRTSPPNLPGRCYVQTSAMFVCAVATQATFPDGKSISYEYDSQWSQVGAVYANRVRLRAAHSSKGLSVKLSYSSWYTLTSATMINDAYASCNYITGSCSSPYVLPSLTFNVVTSPQGAGWTTTVVTDPTGIYRAFEVKNFSSGFVAHKGDVNAPFDISYSNDQGPSGGKGGPNPPTYINYVGGDGVTYNYTYNNYGAQTPPLYYQVFGTRTSSDGRIYRFTGNQQLPRSSVILQETDELGNTRNYQYDQFLRPTNVSYSEGNSEIYGYDGNGNVLQLRRTAKPGSGLSDIIISSSYPTSCSGPLICNKPLSTTDERGNVTQYSWDQSTGNLLRKTLPADASGVSPVTRYSYSGMYAWTTNGAGGYTASAMPISMLTEERTCMRTATVGNACAGGAADEVVTSYQYGAPSGPNNLQVRGKAVSSGGVTALECYGYDQKGNRISVTKANALLTVCP